VFALVQYSFGQIRTGLNTPAEWCEVLILHLNVKTCAAGPESTGSSLQLSLGTKRAGRNDGGHHMDFRLSVPVSSAERFEVAMQAEEGPLGTRDYHLSLEATPVAPGQSFLHFRYSYIDSNAARLAMSTYLHTAGRDKVGFTVTGDAADGAPVYVGGARGAVERNAMRYFLAIETLLASSSKSPASRREWQLMAWFDATEKYRRQLHEVTRAEYLSGKESRPEGSVSDSADTP
jgi:hypothetical protein